MAARSPGFPDRFMPFMEPDRLGRCRPRGARSPTARCCGTSATAGCAHYDVEPEWRRPAPSCRPATSAAGEGAVPVRVIFRCQFCAAVPDAETQRSLERQLRELVCGEYLDALPGRWLVWHGRGPFGPTPLRVRRAPRRPDRLPARALRHARLAARGATMPPPTSRGCAARALAGAEGLWVLVDMHQDLWSERFDGNGAPDWATLDDGQPFAASPFPYGYLQPAVGRSFTSFWTNRDAIRSEYVRAYAALATCSRPSRRSSATTPSTSPRASSRSRRAACRPARGGGRLPRALLPRARARAAPRRPGRPTFYEDWLTTGFLVPVRGASALPNLGLSYHVYCGQPIRPDPCPAQEPQALANGVRNAAANHATALVTEFGATDKLDSSAASPTAPTRRRRLAVLAVQDLRRPHDLGRRRRPRRRVARHPRRRRQGGQGARAGARLPHAHRRARRALELSRERRALPPDLDRGPPRRHRGRAAAARLPARLPVRAHGVRVVRRAPLTLRGSGRASITITRGRAWPSAASSRSGARCRTPSRASSWPRSSATRRPT